MRIRLERARAVTERPTSGPTLVRAAALALALALAACTSEPPPVPIVDDVTLAPPDTTTDTTPPPTPPEPGPFGLPPRVVNTTCRLRGEAGGATPYVAQHIVPALEFDEPAAVVFAPGDREHMYVQDRAGRIHVVPNRPDATTSKLFLDLEDRTVCCAEQGLLGFTFDPGFAENGFFYLYYTVANPKRTRISRFAIAPGDPERAVKESELVLLEIEQPSTNHHGGTLAFGPDGFLYAAIGDGSGNFDLDNGFGQRRDDLHANILRLDVSKSAPGHLYDIPADNPFVDEPGVRPEIWAYGFRNPWRFSFDIPSGRMWIGDVQEASFEELDLGQKGGNYGWNRMEASHCMQPPTDCDDGTLIRPVFEFPHGNGLCAVIGGYVYHGAAMPALEGTYLYGDHCSGRVWSLTYEDEQVKQNVLVASTGLNLTSINPDADGEPVLTSLTGGIYRLGPDSGSSGTGTFPKTLSETGCYADVAARIPAPGVLPYALTTPLWSDGSHKFRYLVLPSTNTISLTPYGAWTFPVGTLIMKQFDLERTVGDPDSVFPIETRFLVLNLDGWHGYSYQWRDDGSDADLLDDGLATEFPITDAAGAPTTQSWYYPSRSDCLICHNAAAAGALGLQTAQLNREVDYDGIVDNQLRAMEHIGLFGGPLPERPSALPRQAALADETASLEARVKSYLNANCAHCHRPGGPTVAVIDLRLETPLAEMGILDIAPTRGDLGIPDARIIKPGDPDHSILYRRMSLRGANQMPPLATAIVDDAAVDVVRRWITSLAVTP